MVQVPPDAAHELLITSFLTAIVVVPPVAKKKKSQVSLARLGLRVSSASYTNAVADLCLWTSC